MSNLVLWLQAYFNQRSKYNIGSEFFKVFKSKFSDIAQTIEYFKTNSLLGDQIFYSESIIQNCINQHLDQGIHIITYDDNIYPKELKTIKNPPLVLFAKGNLELLKKQKIAIPFLVKIGH